MTVRSPEGDALLSYRAFGGVIGVIATFTATLVFLSASAAAVFLSLQMRLAAAAAALVLGITFAVLINSLVPSMQVRLIDPHGRIVVMLERMRRGLRPAASWIITGEAGEPLATASPNALAPYLHEAWKLRLANGSTAVASDPSILRALVRKFLASFDRSFETDLRVELGSEVQGWIRRRTADGSGGHLEVVPTAAIDSRVVLGLAAIVLCGEL